MFGCGRHPGPASATVPLSPLVVTGRGRARAGRAEPLGGAAMEEAGCLHSPCGLHGAWARGGPGPAMEAAGCLHGPWGPSGPEPAMGATGCLDGPCGVHGAWGPTGAGTRGRGGPSAQPLWALAGRAPGHGGLAGAGRPRPQRRDCGVPAPVHGHRCRQGTWLVFLPSRIPHPLVVLYWHLVPV